MNPMGQEALMRRKRECIAGVTCAGLGVGCPENSGRHVAAAGEYSGRHVQ